MCGTLGGKNGVEWSQKKCQDVRVLTTDGQQGMSAMSESMVLEEEEEEEQKEERWKNQGRL